MSFLGSTFFLRWHTCAVHQRICVTLQKIWTQKWHTCADVGACVSLYKKCIYLPSAYLSSQHYECKIEHLIRHRRMCVIFGFEAHFILIYMRWWRRMCVISKSKLNSRVTHMRCARRMCIIFWKLYIFIQSISIKPKLRMQNEIFASISAHVCHSL